jgi:hypothetical protein
MFATVALTKAPVLHGDSGIFDVKSLGGATCHIHRADGGRSPRDGSNFTIPASGDSAAVHAGGSADGASWGTSATGYTVTAVCSLAGQPTATSPAIVVVPWP